MNKKLLSTVMASTMLATSVAPVFAYTIYEGHQEQILVPDNVEKRQEVFNLLKKIVYGKRFQNNASVYALKVKYKDLNTSSDVINFDFNDKNAIKENIDKIEDGILKTKNIKSIQLIDRGHVEKNGICYHYYQEDTNIPERFNKNDFNNIKLSPTIGTTTYQNDVLTVTLKNGNKIEYREGNEKVDFTKPIDANGTETSNPDEVVGFKKVFKGRKEEAIKANQNEIKILNDKLKNGNIKSDYVEKIEYKEDENGRPKGLDFSIVLKDVYTFSNNRGVNEGYVSKTEGNKRTYWFELRNVPDLAKPQFENNDPSTKKIVGFDDYKRVISNPGAKGEEIDGDVISEYTFKEGAPDVEIPHHEELLPKPDNKPTDPVYPIIPDNKPIKPDNKPTVKPIETIAGEDRYDTAIEVAKEIAPVKEIAENGSVVLVNGNALVDGLAAAPLASSVSTTNKVKAAPILLTKTDKLTTSTKDYIEELVSQKKSLGAGKLRVYIVGGEAVVSKNVEKELSDLGVEIIRAGGKNREETSLKVADLMSEKQKSSNAFVVGADGEADAMSIASIAASRKEPIIVSRKGGLSKSAIEKMASLKNTSATIIGGDKVVSANTEKSLKEANINSDRVAGVNRQDTNAKIINRYASSRLDKVLVSKDGQNKKDELVDALTATSLAVKYNAPIVLATNKISDAQIKAIKDNADTKGISISKVGYGIAESVINTIAEKVGLIK